MKGVFWKEGEQFTNSMSLIVSLLIRYPEISTIKLDPKKRSFLFTFMFHKYLAPQTIKKLRDELLLSLEVFSELTRENPSLVKINFRRQNNLSILELTRDISSLSQDEIALVTGIIRERYQQDIVSGQEEEVGEDEKYFQEEMINHMLEDLKDSGQDKWLIGIREEGRVMIFNS